MIRDPGAVKEFEDGEMRRSPPDHARNLAIFAAMWEEACRLRVLPPANPLEGIESDIRLARALNV